MADTEIEWASKVWNFVRGCRRVSLGCGGPNGQGGCYAEKTAYRFSGPGQTYEGLVRLGKHGPQWTGKGRFVAEKLADPLHWRAPRDGSRHRIFVNSMSDLFFEEFSNEQIAAGFGVMATCSRHDFLILTKRPKRAAEWFRWFSAGSVGAVERYLASPGMVESRAARQPLGMSEPPLPTQELRHLYDIASPIVNATLRSSRFHRLQRLGEFHWQPWPISNVWIGVSVEDQKTADERIPLLLQCPAAVRFLSAEPLLGSLDLSSYPKLDWVIFGSESGPGARPMDLAWARSLVRQCADAKVACFTKQIANTADRKGGDPAHWPPGHWPRQFP